MARSRSRSELEELRERIAIEEANLHLHLLRTAMAGDQTEIKARAFGWLTELFSHDYGEMLRMRRASAARGLNLPAEDFSRPYPSPSTSSVTNTQQAASGAMTAIAMASGLGLGGTALAALMAFQSFGKPAPTPIQQPQSQVAADGKYRVRVYWGDREITPGKPAEAEAK